MSLMHHKVYIEEVMVNFRSLTIYTERKKTDICWPYLFISLFELLFAKRFCNGMVDTGDSARLAVHALTQRVFEDLHAARELHERASLEMNAVEKRVEDTSAERIAATCGAIVSAVRYDLRVLERAVGKAAMDDLQSTEGKMVALAERSIVDLESSIKTLTVEPVALATLVRDVRAVEHDAVLTLHEFANFERLLKHREEAVAAVLRVALALLTPDDAAADAASPVVAMNSTSPGVDAAVRILGECRRRAQDHMQVRPPGVPRPQPRSASLGRKLPSVGASPRRTAASSSLSSVLTTASLRSPNPSRESAALTEAASRSRIAAERAVNDLSTPRVRAQLIAALVKQQAFIHEQRRQFLSLAHLEAERNGLRERVAQQRLEISAFVAQERQLFATTQKRFAPTVEGLDSLTRKNFRIAKEIDVVHRKVETIGSECDWLKAELAHAKHELEETVVERDAFAGKISVVLKSASKLRTEATRQRRMVEVATASHASQRDAIGRLVAENEALRAELVGVVREQRGRDARADVGSRDLAALRTQCERLVDRTRSAEADREDAQAHSETLAAQIVKMKVDLNRRVQNAKLAGIASDFRHEFDVMSKEHAELSELVAELSDANNALEERLRSVLGVEEEEEEVEAEEEEEEEEEEEDEEREREAEREEGEKS